MTQTTPTFDLCPRPVRPLTSELLTESAMSYQCLHKCRSPDHHLRLFLAALGAPLLLFCMSAETQCVQALDSCYIRWAQKNVLRSMASLFCNYSIKNCENCHNSLLKCFEQYCKVSVF